MYNTQWLATNYYVAFNALPEPYQNDNCLSFFWEDGKLKCEPASGQEQALGDWTSTYNSAGRYWEGVSEEG